MSTSTYTRTTPQVARQVKRWTIAEFDRLMVDGYIREGSRTYLWDFEIIEPMLENPPHINALANLVDLLRASFTAANWTVNQGHPLVLREGYKPQPDVTILRGPRSRFRTSTPSVADVALLVEVSNTSYSDDIRDFLRGYAEAGVPCYWVVNIPARRVEVYENPDGSTYQKRTDYSLEQSVPYAVEGDEVVAGSIAVIDILRDSLEPSVEGLANP